MCGFRRQIKNKTEKGVGAIMIRKIFASNMQNPETMALAPGQTRNVWRPNTIKHSLVTKHSNVEVCGQTIKTCLIKQRSNRDQTIDTSR